MTLAWNNVLRVKHIGILLSSWGGERTGDVSQKKLHVAIVTHFRGLIVLQFDATFY